MVGKTILSERPDVSTLTIFFGDTKVTLFMFCTAGGITNVSDTTKFTDDAILVKNLNNNNKKLVRNRLCISHYITNDFAVCS